MSVTGLFANKRLHSKPLTTKIARLQGENKLGEKFLEREQFKGFLESPEKN